MSQMLKSSSAVALATLISRLLGLVREMVYARFMGNGWVASAFVFAFTVPNLFRRLLGEGALSAAFIPQFKTKEKTDGEAAMWQAANAVLSGLLAVTSLLSLLVILGVSIALAVGVASERTRLMLNLLRLMFPYMVFVCGAAVCMGMLNARGRFFVPALGSSLLSLVMIASVLWLAPRFGPDLPHQIYALALGVLAAGLAQAAFQMPTLVREGWRFHWVNPVGDPTIRETIRRMLPATIGVATFQLNVVITQSFAFVLGETLLASFQYAVRLMELPQGLFGASLAAYLLPTLAGLAAEKKYDTYRQTLLQGLDYVLVANSLAGALLATLASPIIRLLFEGGRFQATATTDVAQALFYLAPGLVAFSATNILARAFYAVGDTRVPMQISVFCLALNVVLSIAFALPMHAAGLALANTLTSTANALLLGYALTRKFPKLRFHEFARSAAKVAVAALAAATVAWSLSRTWESGPGATTLLARLGAVIAPALGGIAVYILLLWYLRIPAVREVARLFRGKTTPTSTPDAPPDR